MKPRDVVMVTMKARSLKEAFRKTFPDKSAAELYPVWTRFWASVVLAAKVEKVSSVKVHWSPEQTQDTPKDEL